jgi:hypothetical protein
LGLTLALALAAPLADAQGQAPAPAPAPGHSLTLTSPQFEHNGPIPKIHTCEGQDLSPPLAWSGVPAGTQGLVLLVEDPDVPDPAKPVRTWIHWVIYNLPPTSTGLPEGAGKGQLPAGAQGGITDFRRRDYGGPCPPIGRHRYIHSLFALDVALPELKRPTKAEIVKAMAGHILDSTDLIGTYQKEGK